VELLFLLVERGGELVTRDEIVTLIWGKMFWTSARRKRVLPRRRSKLPKPEIWWARKFPTTGFCRF